MDMLLHFALIAMLAGNMLMLVRGWPALARALAGPAGLASAPSRPPADIIPFGRQGRDGLRPVLTPSALRLAA